MNPVRVFALLSHRVPPWDAQPGSTRAPDVDMATAAGLAAGMPELWYKAAMLKWGLDLETVPWLRIRLWMKAMEMAQREHWQTKRLQVVCQRKAPTLLMAEAVLDEIIDPSLSRKSLWEGKERWQKIGYRIGVSGKDAWYRTWEDKYNSLYVTFEDWTGSAYAFVSKRQCLTNREPERRVNVG